MKTNNFFHLITIAIGLIFTITHYLKGIPYTPVLLALFTSTLTVLFIFKEKISEEKRGLVLSCLNLILLGSISYITGGLEAPATRWFHTVFLYLFIVNSRKNIFILLSIFAACASLFIYQHINGALPVSVLGDNNEFITVLSTLSSIIVSFVLLYFYKESMDLSNEQINKSNERYDYVIKGADTGIYDWEDTSSDYVYWSPKLYEIIGQDPAEMKGSAEYFTSRILPEDLKKFNLESINQNANFVKNEYRFIRKDGTIIWVENTAHVIRDEKGHITRYVGALNDITEVKNTQDKLVQEKQNALEAVKTKSVFLSNMTHEIRTPLTSIIGLSELLKDKINSQTKDLVEGISFSATHLLEIVNNILDYNKIEEGKMKLHREPIDIKSFMQNFSLIYEPLLEMRDIKFIISMKELKYDQYSLDPIKLQQILNNLIGNATKFTEKGHIIIWVTGDSSSLEFTVEDTGVGIPKNKLNTVFNSFEQADSTLSKKVQGTGLGLTLTKKLIELMGGSLNISSTEGEGTNITFTIKAKKLDQGIQVQNKKKKVNLPKNINILVAEDNPLNIKIITMMLKSLKLTCDIAEDGEVAIQKSREKYYDIIFMDTQMPKVNGIDATKIIQAEYKKKPYIISFSANNPTETYLFDYIMQKPITKDVLVEALEKHSNRVA